jgi:hypothetical protein
MLAAAYVAMISTRYCILEMSGYIDVYMYAGLNTTTTSSMALTAAGANREPSENQARAKPSPKWAAEQLFGKAVPSNTSARRTLSSKARLIHRSEQAMVLRVNEMAQRKAGEKRK